MKFWHWLLASTMHVDSSHAWVASVILLVVTIRALITPLIWVVYKSGRVLVVMRPKLAAIEERYATDTTPEGVLAHQEERRKVHKEHSYNPFAGCVPGLLQVPFFLGLYRLLLWMAVPDRAQGHSLGLLTAHETQSFQSATFFGVPLTAYLAMPVDQLAQLGTTRPALEDVALPLIVAATFFTTLNTVLSQLRSRSTLEWDNGLSRRMYKLFWLFVPFVPLTILIAGFTGVVPVALLLYWFTGNLWTLGQTILLWWLVVRAFPLDDATVAHIATSRTKAIEQGRAAREVKRSRRRRRASVLIHPTSFFRVRRELLEEKREAKQAKIDARAEKRELARQRAVARREGLKQAREKRAEEKDQME